MSVTSPVHTAQHPSIYVLSSPAPNRILRHSTTFLSTNLLRGDILHDWRHRGCRRPTHCHPPPQKTALVEYYEMPFPLFHRETYFSRTWSTLIRSALQTGYVSSNRGLFTSPTTSYHPLKNKRGGGEILNVAKTIVRSSSSFFVFPCGHRTRGTSKKSE